MIKRFALVFAVTAGALWFSGCAGTGPRIGGTYDAVAYKPHNPDNVRVKVSLQNRAVYVMEGDRPLLVTATAIGLPTNPTPTGNFRMFEPSALTM